MCGNAWAIRAAKLFADRIYDAVTYCKEKTKSIADAGRVFLI